MELLLVSKEHMFMETLLQKLISHRKVIYFSEDYT